MKTEQEMRPTEQRPPWWPTNPYPADIFPMTIEEYVAAVPDPDLRTAISGCLMREGWRVAECMFTDRLRSETGRMKTEAEIRDRMAKWEAELAREQREHRPDREIKNLCYARLDELRWALGE